MSFRRVKAMKSSCQKLNDARISGALHPFHVSSICSLQIEEKEYDEHFM